MIDVGTALKALGAHGGTAAAPLLVGYMLFTPSDDFDRHVAESERTYILDVVEKARGEPPGAFKDSLCRTLDEALGRLCAASRDDALCLDRAMLRERAGCE